MEIWAEKITDIFKSSIEEKDIISSNFKNSYHNFENYLIGLNQF